MVNVGLVREPGKLLNVIEFDNIINSPFVTAKFDIEKLESIALISIKGTDCSFVVTYDDMNWNFVVNYLSDEDLQKNISNITEFFKQKYTKEMYENRDTFSYVIPVDSTDRGDAITFQQAVKSGVPVEEISRKFRFGRDVITTRGLVEKLPNWSNFSK